MLNIDDVEASGQKSFFLHLRFVTIASIIFQDANAMVDASDLITMQDTDMGTD